MMARMSMAAFIMLWRLLSVLLFLLTINLFRLHLSSFQTFHSFHFSFVFLMFLFSGSALQHCIELLDLTSQIATLFQPRGYLFSFALSTCSVFLSQHCHPFEDHIVRLTAHTGFVLPPVQLIPHSLPCVIVVLSQN